MKKSSLALLAAIICGTFMYLGVSLDSIHQNAGSAFPSVSQIAVPVGVYPDVPGALNSDITQSNISQTICNSGWSTKSIRPPTSYTDPIKIQKIKERNFIDQNPSDYELDHSISLELGGAPKDPNNLWAEPYNISYEGLNAGAHQKDVVENLLHKEVCGGTITLQEAQHEIATDWFTIYQSMQTKAGSNLSVDDPDDD